VAKSPVFPQRPLARVAPATYITYYLVGTR
jgi:hypothetical protein